jgi:hypothetical protein
LSTWSLVCRPSTIGRRWLRWLGRRLPACRGLRGCRRLSACLGLRGCWRLRWRRRGLPSCRRLPTCPGLHRRLRRRFHGSPGSGVRRQLGWRSTIRSRDELDANAQHGKDRLPQIFADPLNAASLLLEARNIVITRERQAQNIVVQPAHVSRVYDEPRAALGLLHRVENLRPCVAHLLGGDGADRRWGCRSGCCRLRLRGGLRSLLVSIRSFLAARPPTLAAARCSSIGSRGLLVSIRSFLATRPPTLASARYSTTGSARRRRFDRLSDRCRSRSRSRRIRTDSIRHSDTALEAFDTGERAAFRVVA